MKPFWTALTAILALLLEIGAAMAQEPIRSSPLSLGPAMSEPGFDLQVSAPVFAAATAYGMAFALPDARGGTWLVLQDHSGKRFAARHLELASTGLVGCGKTVILTGLELPQGKPVALQIDESGRSSAATALPINGHLLHGPTPVCRAGSARVAWCTQAERPELGAVRLDGSRAVLLSRVTLPHRPLELELVASPQGVFAAWTEGPELVLAFASLEPHGAKREQPAQAIRGVGSPRLIATREGFVLVAVTPQGLGAIRFDAQFKLKVPWSELGRGTGPLALIAGEHNLAALVFAEGSAPGNEDGSHEGVRARAPRWLALIELATFRLGPRRAVAPSGRFMAGAFTASGLVLLHGAADLRVTRFATPGAPDR